MIAERLCERCGGAFVPREAKQRFCCRGCSVEFYDDERREAVAFYRKHQAEQAKERAA
jgi:hypothetical protein